MRGPVRSFLVLLAGTIVLVACQTGERPTLGDPVDVGGASGTPTGSTAADAVLAHLEGEQAPVYTATYRIVRKLGPTETLAVAARDADRRSLTVGDVRFLLEPQGVTCDLASGACDDGVLEQRISDYSVPTGFVADSAARRIRLAVTRRAPGSEPIASEQLIANQPSDCVDIAIGTGTESYCAGDAGIVTRWDSADLLVELQSFEPSAADSLFTSTRS